MLRATEGTNCDVSPVNGGRNLTVLRIFVSKSDPHERRNDWALPQRETRWNYIPVKIYMPVTDGKTLWSFLL